MGRSGYSYDLDNLELGRWRAQVASAMRGKRGQRFLRDLAESLDAMPVKELISGEVHKPETGAVCAIGCIARARGVDLSPVEVDPQDFEDDPEWLAGWASHHLDIATQLAKEVQYVNDEVYTGWTPGKGWGDVTDAKRWEVVRAWVAKAIGESVPA